MKTYYVWEKDSDWGMIVCGETVGKVKHLALVKWPDDFLPEYINLRVKRLPQYDNLLDKPVILSNQYLPFPFWSNEW